MKLTIETVNKDEIELILRLFKKFDFEKITLDETIPNDILLVHGDKSENPGELFGIWKDNPRTIEQIRNMGWSRNWDF
jgi:hypothetical protein